MGVLILGLSCWRIALLIAHLGVALAVAVLICLLIGGWIALLVVIHACPLCQHKRNLRSVGGGPVVPSDQVLFVVDLSTASLGHCYRPRCKAEFTIKLWFPSESGYNTAIQQDLSASRHSRTAGYAAAHACRL